MDENILLQVLRSVRFPMDVEGIERFTDLSRDTIEEAIRILQKSGYIERSDCGTTCSVCPLRSTCGFRDREMWVITQKGISLLMKYRQKVLKGEET